MRLNELIAPRKQDAFNLITQTFAKVDNERTGERIRFVTDLLTELQNRGFRPLGYGAFGMAFTHPSLDYVVKIFKADEAYIEFIRFAIEHQDNPALPKFKGRFVRLGKKEEKLYAVRMEKLQPTGGRFVIEKEFLRQIYAALACDKADNYLDAVTVVSSDAWIERMKRRGQMLDRVEGYFRSLAEDQSFIDTAVTAIGQLTEIRDQRKLTFDLHEGNFMMRDYAQLVIIDPFC